MLRDTFERLPVRVVGPSFAAIMALGGCASQEDQQPTPEASPVIGAIDEDASDGEMVRETPTQTPEPEQSSSQSTDLVDYWKFPIVAGKTITLGGVIYTCNEFDYEPVYEGSGDCESPKQNMFTALGDKLDEFALSRNVSAVIDDPHLAAFYGMDACMDYIGGTGYITRDKELGRENFPLSVELVAYFRGIPTINEATQEVIYEEAVTKLCP